ncbi:MAG: hypothetical protein ACREYE_20360 [Gammaproteobacteria bacterium]
MEQIKPGSTLPRGKKEGGLTVKLFKGHYTRFCRSLRERGVRRNQNGYRNRKRYGRTGTREKISHRQKLPRSNREVLNDNRTHVVHFPVGTRHPTGHGGRGIVVAKLRLPIHAEESDIGRGRIACDQENPEGHQPPSDV